MLSNDRVIARIATGQMGLVTLGQLVEAGVTKHALHRRAAAGSLVRVQPGVYRIGGAEVTWRQAVLASQLASPPSGVISHRAAAHLHGLPGTRGAVIDLSHPRHEEPMVRGVVRHRPVRSEEVDATSVGTYRVTTIERTLVDRAAVVPPARLTDLVDSAMRGGLTSFEAIETRLEQLAERGRTGLTALRTVLAERVGHLDAEVFEHRMAQLIEARSIPRPARQHRVDLNAAADGTNRFVLLDFAWARLRDDPDRVVGQIRAVLGGVSCAPRN